MELVHSGLKENHGAHTDYIRINIMQKNFTARDAERAQKMIKSNGKK